MMDGLCGCGLCCTATAAHCHTLQRFPFSLSVLELGFGCGCPRVYLYRSPTLSRLLAHLLSLSLSLSRWRTRLLVRRFEPLARMRSFFRIHTVVYDISACPWMMGGASAVLSLLSLSLAPTALYIRCKCARLIKVDLFPRRFSR